MGDLDLTDINAKLAWARGHFQSADSEIAAWLKDDAHRIIHERNEDFTQHYLRAEFGTQPELTRWSLMVGDCITNLRDTLDYLIYGIAHLPSSPMPVKAQKAAFVIRTQPSDFNADARSRLCSVPDPIRDAVLNLQPFNRPHPILPPLLAVLSELANGTKHKLLNIVFTMPEILDVEFIGSGNPNPQAATFAIHRQGIMEGRPFAVFETPMPDPHCYLKSGNIGFGIAIGYKSLAGNTAFDAGHTSYRILLQMLFDEVEHVISTLTSLLR